MEILNLGEAGHSPFPKRAKSAVLGVAVIATIVALSSTLAANININSGPIEFGQGVAQTVSCVGGDVSVIVTPSSSFTNSDGGAFAMSSITVSDILDTCNGKVFTIKVYDNSNNEPLSIGTLPGAGAADNSVMIWWGNGYFEGENPIVGANEALVSFPNSGDVYWNDDGNSYNNGYAIETAYDGVSGLFDPGAFKFNLPTPIDATQVYKITLETQDDSSALNIGGVSGQGFYAYYID